MPLASISRPLLRRPLKTATENFDDTMIEIAIAMLQAHEQTSFILTFRRTGLSFADLQKTDLQMTDLSYRLANY